MSTLTEKLRPALLDKLQRVSDFERWMDMRVPVYKGDPAKESSPSRVALSARFASLSSLGAAVQAGDFGALEAALLLVGRSAPGSVEDEAIYALDEGWPHLQESAVRVLGGCSTERSFRALLGALLEVTAAGFELRNNGYEQGAQLTWVALSAHPAVSPIPAAADLAAAYTPRQRLEAQALLAFLGTSPDDATLRNTSLDLLRKVYAEHPERYLRMAAGHALCERGDEQSLKLLIRLENATDDWGRFFAVKALMQLDPTAAFKRLEPRLSEPDFTSCVIRLLLLQSQSAVKANPVAGWLPEDPGWLGWLAGIRKDRKLGQSAQGILRAYKGQVPAPTKPDASKPKPRRAGTPSRLNPAVSEAVAAYVLTPSPTAWRALSRTLGNNPLDAEATTATLPAVQRFVDQALSCIRFIHTELQSAGYRFLAKQPIDPPKTDAKKQLERLEQTVGPLPLTLRAWHLTVGAIDLRGQLDDWGINHTDFLSKDGPQDVVRTDPLMVRSLAEALDELDAWNEHQPFEFPLGPDADGKAGYSAGDVRLLVTGPTLDAKLLDAPKKAVFSDVIRHSLKYAGFPGLARRAAKDPLLRRLMRELPPL